MRRGQPLCQALVGLSVAHECRHCGAELVVGGSPSLAVWSFRHMDEPEDRRANSYCPWVVQGGRQQRQLLGTETGLGV